MRRTIYHEKLEGLEVERLQRDYEFTMPTKHFHNEYEIYYLVEGERYYFIENQTYLVNQGNLVLINKHQIHKTSTGSSSNHDRILLQLDADRFQDIAKNLGIPMEDFFMNHFGVFELGYEGRMKVEEIFYEIEKEIIAKMTGYESVIRMKVMELILFVIRCKSNLVEHKSPEIVQTAKYQKVHEVAEYIIMNHQSSLSLDNIAKRFFVSKCYLSRIYKEVTGFTVNEFINMQKIRAAQELLKNETYSITEISQMLGYESITYFEKVFRKYVETSPLKYRKKNIGTKETMREKQVETKK